MSSRSANAGGASVEAAKKYPEHAFAGSKKLSDKIVDKYTPKVGVYTGSFDPPHAGHENIVRQMKEKFGLDKVYIVPDRTTAYKPGMQSVKNREKMIKLLFQDTPGIDVLPANTVSKMGKGEMWDVINAVEADNPKAKVFSIMGTDTLQWYETLPPEHRNKNVTILVNERDPSVKVKSSIGGQKVVAVNLNDKGFSSSEVRQQVRFGKQTDQLTPRVREFIDKNNLYQATGETKTPEEIRKFFKDKGKKVITFMGYSGAGYQDEAKMLEQARKILSKADPKKTIINIGATTDGIGKVYELAKKMGFETTGVVSEMAKKYGGLSPYSDTSFYVKDDSWGGYRKGSKTLTDTSKAMIENSDLVVSIGGGAVSADEFDAARAMGKDAIFFEADLDHKIATNKAKKNSQPLPKDFKGDAHGSIAGSKKRVPSSVCGNSIVTDLILRKF
ncbi:MAG: nicotinate-nicotinamide nucleotide adenylyltransferase [Halobacteriovoraceae bacterium]|jgi:nicotinate (nicotinamide) nucleotide adenylyltransferase|nr:nicotinate-nicotinamide nucleotide adenylyltransferase [Halobacteriovoraceae bacterium]MBT5093633.1 nicotinate-nicotinamide nucleotide adenylyltransferase [Halobacteriovoraceae bacterium]